MATYEITTPDGATYQVTAPDNATQDEVLQRVQQQALQGVQQAPAFEESPAFERRISAMTPQAMEIQRARNTPFGEYLRQKAQLPVEGESEEQRAQRLYGSLPQRERPGVGMGMLRAGLQGATFGFGDELAAAAAAATGGGGTFGQRYDQYVAREREDLERFREDQPVLAYGTEMAGAIPTAAVPLGAVGRAAQAGRLGTRMAASGAVGAGQGGVYGFGAGEGDLGDRAAEAARGAALGGVVGAAAPVVAGGAQKVAQEIADSRAVQDIVSRMPTTQGLKASAQRLYDRVRNADITVAPQRLQSFAIDLADDLAGEAIDPTLHPRATAILKRFQDASSDPKNAPDFMTMRLLAKGVADSTDPSEARLGNIMVSAVDDMVETLGPNDVVAGNPQGVSALLKQARNLWGRYRRSEMIDAAVDRAKNQASGFENGLRTRFRQILDNPKKRRGFTPEEIRAMERVVRGTFTGNTLRRLGRMSSMGSGQQTNMLGATLSASAGGALGGMAGGAPGAAIGAFALPAAGYVAQKGGEAITRRHTDIARALIASDQAWQPAQVRSTVAEVLGNILSRNVPATAQAREALPR